MTHAQLQQLLKDTGRYGGIVDDKYGPLEGGAVMLAMSDGPDTKLTPQDFLACGIQRAVPVNAIKAIFQVESPGPAFQSGRPIILFEPHRFSKATGGKYDATHPAVSYHDWDPAKYPVTQAGRYAQLLEAISLDVDAGFASASYGRAQILGENFAACGYASAAEFAFAQARDEKTQLNAFGRFIDKAGITPFLRKLQWDEVAKRYNGTQYRQNKYDEKLAAAYKTLAG